MKTVKITTTVDVTSNKVKHGFNVLDQNDGFTIANDNERISTKTTLRLGLLSYKDLIVGDIFVIDDDEIDFDDVSIYEMRAALGNIYLTGEDDSPLGMNDNKYKDVWIVLE